MQKSILKIINHKITPDCRKIWFIFLLVYFLVYLLVFVPCALAKSKNLKPRLLVGPFGCVGCLDNEKNLLSDAVNSIAVQLGQFRVKGEDELRQIKYLEWKSGKKVSVKKICRELSAFKCLSKIGRLMGIKKSVQGKIIHSQSLYQITLTLVDLKKGQKLNSKTIRCDNCKLIDLLPKVDMAAMALLEFRHSQPLSSGVVVKDKPLGNREGRPRISRQIIWRSITGGVFFMGSDQGEADERIVFKVRLKPFKITQTEITVEQYKKCVQQGKCSQPDTGENCNWVREGFEQHPVNCVNWRQADAFCNWIGGRLPTEAEWECAAKGGRNHKYPWGNQRASCQYAVMDFQGNGCGKGHTWPVCSKSSGSTPLGICDMAGNVWEWTSDCYKKNYSTLTGDNYSDQEAECELKVLRGGGWDSIERYLSTFSRGGNWPDFKFNHIGFRCVK